MTKKTTATAPATPARPSRRTPGIAVRSGLRGGDTEKTEQSTTTKSNTTGAAGNPALPTLIIVK